MDDQPHGHGVYFYNNGEVYRGHYNDGDKCGEGEYLKPDGGIYQGMWLKDKKHGPGKLYDAETKDLVIGVWENDFIVEIHKYFEVNEEGEAIEQNPMVFIKKKEEEMM